MKFILKNILKYYLKYIAKLVLLIHQPVIIAVAGSSNKTFVKEKIVEVFQAKNLTVRSNPKNFNTEIGLPLAILNLPSGYNSYRAWWPIIKNSFLKLGDKVFPKYLILELGSSDPGDMQYLLSIVKPKIAVITDITQRYIESFSDMDALVKEYAYLAKYLPPDGFLITNNDNQRTKKLRTYGGARVITYGFDQQSDYNVLDIKQTEKEQILSIRHANTTNQYTINKFGQHHIYAHLVGLIIKDYVALQK